MCALHFCSFSRVNFWRWSWCYSSSNLFLLHSASLHHLTLSSMGEFMFVVFIVLSVQASLLENQ